MTPAQARLTSPLSLAAGALAVVVMALWGFNSLTAPFAKDQAAATDGSCAGKPTGHTIKRGGITVSVYNAGKRAGRAGATLDLLEGAGFQPGAIGNAPKGTHVAVAEVRSLTAIHPEATLVARALGKNVQVRVVQDDLGPGVDVIIGDKFKHLNPSAPTSVRVPSRTCG